MHATKIVPRSALIVNILVILFLILAVSSNLEVSAQGPELVRKYFEDFEDETLEGWTLSSCAVLDLEDNHVLGCSPPVVEVAQFPALALLDSRILGEEPFLVRFRFRSDGGLLNANVMAFPGEEQGGHYFAEFIIDQGVMQNALYRLPADQEPQLVASSDPLDFEPDIWYQVEISYQDGLLEERVLIEGDPILELQYFDPQPLSPGFLAFQDFNGEFYFDDIEIWGPPEPTPPPRDFYVFSGQVLQGDPDSPGEPLSGVPVAVFGADQPHPVEGEFLGESQSGRGGFFELPAPAGYEFYSLRLIDPGRFIPVDSRSINGVSQDPDWIEFTLPLEDLDLGGNEFFVLTRAAEVLTLAGQVLIAEPGAGEEPFEGAAVAVFGANSPFPDEGENLGEVASGPGGFFQVDFPAGFEFYSLRLFLPEDFVPVDAFSPGGAVRAPDWIEYPAPFDDRPVDGNQFFVIFSEPQIPPTPAWDYPACDPDETLLAQTDFVDGNLDGIEVSAGWRTESNLLVTDTVADARLGSADWDNYRLRLGMIIGEGGGGLLIHLNESGNQGYSYFIQPGFAALAKNVDGEEVYSNSQQFPMEPMQWFEMQAGAEGGRIWLAVDGEVILEFDDPEPLSGGPIRFETTGQNQVAIDVLWVCSQQVPPPPTPTQPVDQINGGCILGIFCEPTDWLILILGVLILAGVLLGGAWLLFRGPGDPSQPGRLLPPTPGLPPIRLVNAWLSQGPGGTGKPLSEDVALAAGSSYTLHVQVQPRQQVDRRSDVMTQEYPLDVVFYSLDGEFSTNENTRVTIQLPPQGASQEALFNLQPLKTGSSRVRAGVYYQNVLLQSVYLDLHVAEKSRSQSGAIQRGIDYVASSRFQELPTLGSPHLSLFTNQARDGDRWIGLFSTADGSPDWLQQGAVHKFSTSYLAARAVDARKALKVAAGERLYLMDYQLPMDADTLDRRADDLVALAKHGYTLFDALFFSTLGSQKKDYLRGMSQLLSQPEKIISIARIRDDGTSFPWSALYSYYLDDTQELQLCPVFRSWLQVQGEQRSPHAGENLLDDPQACRARADCPLGGDDADRTVCPFGFWGFMHKVEQPLKLVEPVDIKTVPQELKEPTFEATSRILVEPGQRVRMDMAEYAEFDELPGHEKHLQELADPAVLDLTTSDDPQVIKKMLAEGGRHLLYFFCHGVVVGNQFKLEVGSQQRAEQISASHLNWMRIDWPDHPQTLVFLNGCESMAFTPELVHGFMGKLSNLGASGVIGVEINNWSEFAAPFAEHLLGEFIDGRMLGDAFLASRREFLRRGNPLGLVYSLHGQARLHLHQQAGCPHCAAVELAGSGIPGSS